MNAAWAMLAMTAASAFSAPVPAGARLNIQFTFRDNNNLLRGKASPSYLVTEDGYKETVWIEGPFAASTICQIVNYQRTDASIKMAKVLTFFAYGEDRLRTFIKPNPWGYADYATPDFLAALIKAGMYYYCPDVAPPLLGEADTCPSSTALLGSPNAQRQNALTGGIYSLSSPGRTQVTQTYTGCLSLCIGHKNGNLAMIPDGVSGATRYPALNTGNVSLTWDMKDYQGGQIQEGFYVVWAQMSAERGPRTFESGTLVNGKEAVHIETCWDNPAYNNIGHHRVVEKFYLSDSGFTKTVYQEKKWSGDTYNYLGSAGMTFTYTVPIRIENGGPAQGAAALTLFPNPVGPSGRIRLTGGRMGIILSEVALFGLHGALLRTLPVSEDGEISVRALGTKGGPSAPGLYLLRGKIDGKRFSRPLLIVR